MLFPFFHIYEWIQKKEKVSLNFSVDLGRSNGKLSFKSSSGLLVKGCLNCCGCCLFLVINFSFPKSMMAVFSTLDVPLFLPVFFLPCCYSGVCALTSFPKKFPCFCLSWHLVSLPHMFLVYREIHISFQPLCLLKKNISWWYLLLLITHLFRKFWPQCRWKCFTAEKLKLTHFQLVWRQNTYIWLLKKIFIYLFQ